MCLRLFLFKHSNSRLTLNHSEHRDDSLMGKLTAVNHHVMWETFQSFQVLHHNLCQKINELIYVEFWSCFTSTSKRRNEKIHFALKKIILGPIGIVIFLLFGFLI